jgi:hypothetical protein
MCVTVHFALNGPANYFLTQVNPPFQPLSPIFGYFKEGKTVLKTPHFLIAYLLHNHNLIRSFGTVIISFQRKVWSMFGTKIRDANDIFTPLKIYP